MDQLKKRLSLEAKYQLHEDLMDELLAAGEMISLSCGEALIDVGEHKPDIFIVKKGLVRGSYLDSNMDKTVGFALPGTLLISFHCYYGAIDSYYRFEALCETEVIRIRKRVFDQMVNRSHEFALWVLSAHQNQLFYNEMRNSILTGDARTRLKQLTSRLTDLKIKDPNTTFSITTKVTERMVLNEVNERWKKIYNLIPSKIIASYLGITEVHLSRIKRELIMESMKKSKA